MSDLDAIANMPETVKIGDKEYQIKAPSLGVSALVARKMRELLDLMEFDIAKFDKEKTSFEDLYLSLIKGLYGLFSSEKAEKAVDIISEILALLINNRPPHEEGVITKEEIKWNMSISDFIPLLVSVMKKAKISDFFLMLLKTAQVYDIEGVLSTSQDSSSLSHKPQAGQSST